jgi:peptidylprolyl isomerase
MRIRGTTGTIAGLCAVVSALLLVIAGVGCGGGNSSDASANDSTEPGILDSPPEIEVPEGLPPKKFIVKDLQKGTGTEAKKGDNVMIQYYGVQWNDGIEHSNSWHYPHIPVFQVGSHRLLRGLNMALPGMKEGGSREVIIPHNYVYYPDVVSHIHLSRLDALIYKVYLVKVLDEKNQR